MCFRSSLPQEMYGPLFMESDPKQPPFPQPGTEGTIPYFVCLG